MTTPTLTEPVIRQIISGMFHKYSKVKHQIETMDQFMFQMIPSIIEESSVNVIKSKKMKRTHVIRFGKVTMYKPTVKTPTGAVRPILPQECRKRGLTYSSDVHVDVTHEIYDSSTVDGLEENEIRVAGEVVHTGPVNYGRLLFNRTYREVLLCEIPVMLYSGMCHLSEQRDAVMYDEDLYDTGGYFVVNGNEKFIIPQMALRTNFPYVSKEKRNQRYAYTNEIRSFNEKKIRSTSTLYIRLTRVKKDRLPQVLVTVPFIKCPIPLCAVFRLIGVDSAEEMYQYIMNENHVPEMEYLASAVLRDRPKDNYMDLSIDDLCDKIGKKGTQEATRDKRLRYVKHIFHNEFLPHMGLARLPEVRRAKALYLGSAVLKMLLAHKDVIKEDDRDHLANKRVLTPGLLCGLQFRQQMRVFLKALTIVVHRCIDTGKFFNMNEMILPKRITSGFKYALSTGNWGQFKGGTTMKGVAQMLPKMTPLAALSHLRRINTPLNREGKAPEPRQLPPSHFMLICGIETPEGPPCGLIGNLALSAVIRIGAPTSPIIRLIHNSRLLRPLLECTAEDFRTKCKVMINGIWIGATDEPQKMHQMLRTARQYQDIPFDTSITLLHSAHRFQLLINTDTGAFLHPVLVVDKLHLVPELHRLYGHVPMTFWDMLMTEGVIEFLEKEEEETCRVAMRLSDLATGQYTHVQIHPSLMCGAAASLIPFPEHNQAPRNMYQSSMGKQAMGAPATNYLSRTESKMQVLDYLQKPIISTYSAMLLGHDDLPSSANVVAGILVYTGYNQEDSVILNLASVQKGLFRSTCFQLFKDAEKAGGTTDRDAFEKPQADKTLGMQHANYSKLNPEDGIIDAGVRVSDRDAIIGKVMISGASQKKNKPDTVIRDRSTLWKSNEEGVVDQVMLSSGLLKEDMRTTRVRIRSQRIPEIGDKLSSRHGQKGVIGILMPPEDMPRTADGMPLDLIINPHAISSRMTIAHLMEMLLGKVCCMEGEIGDGTPFRYTSIEQIAEVMAQYPHLGNRYGNQVLYSGLTGERLQDPAFVGVIAYQRLRHQTRDKVHARARGPVQLLTRQPTEGRSRDGGLRFGEMERDMTVSHGAAFVLEDRMFLQSDKFDTVVCTQCGLLAEKGRSQNYRRYHYVLSHSEEYYCRTCRTGEFVRELQLPYAFKLFMQEMGGCHINMSLQVAEDKRAAIKGQTTSENLG